MEDIFIISGIKKNSKICGLEELEEDKAIIKKGYFIAGYLS